MDAMRDYVTPQERTNVFQKFDIKRKFIVEELNDIYYRRSSDDKLKEKLESALYFINSKTKGN